MNKDYDFYETILKKYMDINDEGEPYISIDNALLALEEADIPEFKSTKLIELMLPQNRSITCENFMLTVLEHAQNSINVTDEEEDSDEEYTDSNSNTEFSSGDNENFDKVYDLLTNSKNQLTLTSLKKSFDKINFHVSNDDLRKMLELANNKEDFRKIWNEIYS